MGPPQPPRVLVVEDDPKFGELVVRALSRAGLCSVLADSGDAAQRGIRWGPASLRIDATRLGCLAFPW